MSEEKTSLPTHELRESSDEQAGGQTRNIHGWRWVLFNASTLISIFVYSVDNTIVANISPVIVNTFDAVPDLPWLSVGFMIGGFTMVLPLGKWYMTFDAKWVYIVSTIVFLAASALCGAAPNMTAEIIGRVFAGAGGNGMYLGLLSLMSMNTTERERPVYLSLTGLVWGLGTVLGPLLGGAFEIADWRWAFYMNLFFGIILVPTYFYIIPSNHPLPGVSWTHKILTFDWVGALGSIAALVTLICAINFGGTLLAWDSGGTIALFVVSGALWIAFAVQQSLSLFTTRESRLLPVHVLLKKEPMILFVACASVGAVSYVSIYYIPLYFQFTRGDGAVESAVRMLPFICLLITAILSSGQIVGRLGHYKPIYIIGSTFSLVSAVLMSTIVHVDTPIAILYGLEVALGFGAGFYTQAAFAVIQAVVPPTEAGDGLTLMLLAQMCGLTFGLSIAGAVFVNTAQNGLYEILPDMPRALVQQIVAGTSSNVLETLSEDLRYRALEVIVSSIKHVFVCVYAAAALSLICGVLMSHRKANVSAAPPA